MVEYVLILTKIFFSLLFGVILLSSSVAVSYSQEGTSPDWADKQGAVTAQGIPDWVKKNADWWSQGLISDKDFAAGLGFMVKEKIIKVDNVAFDSDGSVAISDDLSIPKWIHTNAKWWVDGAISDDDFKQGIQFMVKEKLIDFTAKKTPQSNLPVLDEQTKKQIIQHESNILLANTLALEQLLEMQNFVASTLDDSADEAWKQYSENKNTDYMNSAIIIESTFKIIQTETVQTVQSLKESKEITTKFFDAAKNDGFDTFVLKNNAEEELSILDAPSKIHTSTDLKNAGKSLKKFDRFIQKDLDTVESLSGVPIPQSSSFSKGFGVSGVENADSKYHGIDSLDYGASCTSDSVCDSSLGEGCAKREGETSGYCIPTWFGIKHAWAPVSLMNDRIKYYEVDSILEDTELADIEIVPLKLQSIMPTCISSGGNLCIRGDLNSPEEQARLTEWEETDVWEDPSDWPTNPPSLPNDSLGENKLTNLYDSRIAIFFPDNLPDEFKDCSQPDCYDDIEIKILECNLSSCSDSIIISEPVEPVDGGMQQLIPVTVLNIDGIEFPISQFALWKWTGECDDVWHYHTPTGHAIAIDGVTGISDPDQANCGFGKVGHVFAVTSFMSQSEIDKFKDRTNSNPLTNEAMMGGSDTGSNTVSEGPETTSPEENIPKTWTPYNGPTLNDNGVTTSASSGKEFDDADGDGIEDGADPEPNKKNNEFGGVDSENKALERKIVNRGDLKVTISHSAEGTVSIEVGTDGNSESVIIEIMGVELELDAGTILEAQFG